MNSEVYGDIKQCCDQSVGPSVCPIRWWQHDPTAIGGGMDVRLAVGGCTEWHLKLKMLGSPTCFRRSVPSSSSCLPFNVTRKVAARPLSLY